MRLHTETAAYSLWEGDARAVLRGLPAESVHCCVTSPPYFGLRDYGHEGQVGLEETPEAYAAALVETFAEVKRVLRRDGTLWLNLGDSYAANRGRQVPDSKWGDVGNGFSSTVPTGCKEKDLLGIPWLVAFALRADGWYLRSEITLCKRAPMPESVRDRPTQATEKLFLLTREKTYFYDQDAERVPAQDRPAPDPLDKTKDANGTGWLNNRYAPGPSGYGHNPSGRNLWNYWMWDPECFPLAHFATFPTWLPRRCINLGTSERGCCPACGAPWRRVVERGEPSMWQSCRKQHDYGDRKAREAPGNNYKSVSRGRPENSGVGYNTNFTTGWQPSCACDAGEPAPATVLDPFAGSGTTGAVAVSLGRRFVGVELNPAYCRMAARRISGGLNLFSPGVAVLNED